MDPPEIAEKTDNLMNYTIYEISREWNQRRLKMEPVKIEIDPAPSTNSEDLAFISEIRAMLFNLLKEDLKLKLPFSSVVQIYLEAVKLTSHTKKVKRAPTVYFDFDDYNSEDEDLLE